MTRTVALRASVLFIALTVLSGALGLGSHAPIAEILFGIGVSLAAVMLAFAFVRPQAPEAVPVRVRRVRSPR